MKENIPFFQKKKMKTCLSFLLSYVMFHILTSQDFNFFFQDFTFSLKTSFFLGLHFFSLKTSYFLLSQLVSIMFSLFSGVYGSHALPKKKNPLFLKIPKPRNKDVSSISLCQPQIFLKKSPILLKKSLSRAPNLIGNHVYI